ncbi:type VI secretion system baseplate subunit TssG [Acinetobacter populi]|uniref:Type VI secretion protein n=1 Tax=Acinetobacter populi TaxID=1582270 RepID=A0A1Z9Z1F9_9GAMM|nr:type VI secretion system baseplate subunit TssG [Acinetobacter populi]OUY08252.1 type VI secretion protein [Acinetobacter populi]
MEQNKGFQLLKDEKIDNIPYLFDMGLFTLLRSLENIFELQQKLGDELRFGKNNFRFGQSAHMSFQPRQVRQIEQKNKYVKVDINGFGLFGPNGPLPLHITEYIYEKKIHQKEQTFNDFLDIFHHRLISLFYKSWRNAQDVISLDNQDIWQFSRYIASLTGSADHQNLKKDIHIYNKFYYTGYLLNQNIPVNNLKDILSQYFDVPIEIKENIGQWIYAKEFSTYLSYTKENVLGQGLLIGDKIFDATQKFRIVIGPLAPNVYLKFLPGNILAKKLIAWVEQYIRYQYQWDVEIIIDRPKIIQQTLGGELSLGFTSWIGQPQQDPIVIIQY